MGYEICPEACKNLKRHVWSAEAFRCDPSVPSGNGLQSKNSRTGPVPVLGDAIYKELYKEQDLIFNLASEEYAKTVRKYLDGPDRFVDVEFLTMRNGKLRTIVAWAKMARGQMIRHIVKNRIDRPEDIKSLTGTDMSLNLPCLRNPSMYLSGGRQSFS